MAAMRTRLSALAAVLGVLAAGLTLAPAAAGARVRPAASTPKTAARADKRVRMAAILPGLDGSFHRRIHEARVRLAWAGKGGRRHWAYPRRRRHPVVWC